MKNVCKNERDIYGQHNRNSKSTIKYILGRLQRGGSVKNPIRKNIFGDISLHENIDWFMPLLLKSLNCPRRTLIWRTCGFNRMVLHRFLKMKQLSYLEKKLMVDLFQDSLISGVT